MEKKQYKNKANLAAHKHTLTHAHGDTHAHTCKQVTLCTK